MMMTMMTTNINRLLDYLDELFPLAKCELFYTKDYELTIAVSLSAQTTDVATNKVTTVLFNKYPTLEALSRADIKDVEEINPYIDYGLQRMLWCAGTCTDQDEG